MEIKLNPLGMIVVSNYGDVYRYQKEIEAEVGAQLQLNPENALLIERSITPLTRTYLEGRDILDSVLRDAGYSECRVRHASTGKSRYVADAEGYRHHMSLEHPTVVPDTYPLRSHKVWYLGLRGLKKYLSALHNAGIEAYISGTDLHPTTRTVWVMPPFAY